MASQLTPAEVAHIADLARLELSDAEREAFARQLTDILSYAAAIQSVDTALIRAASGERGPEADGWRADAPAASLDRDIVLAQAPDPARDAGLFRVPKVL